MTRRGTPCTAAIAVLTALLCGLVLASPAEAGDRSSGGDRSEVEFAVEGLLCRSDVARAWSRRGGRARETLTGTVTSGIGLLSGELTVHLTTVTGKDGTAAFSGRWRLEPATSNGTVEGRLRGSIDGTGRSEASWSGSGRDALRGVRLGMESVGRADGSCDAGRSIAGTGTATARPDRPPRGAVVVESARGFADTLAALTAAVNGNPNLTLVAVVDHAAAAATRGLALGPTTELFFGNPNIGTPLMQASQSTGIDLPQKMLVWEDPLGVVRVAYNAPAYLQSRHGIEGADTQLTTVANALAALAGAATGTTVEPVFDAGRVRHRAGLVSLETDRTPDEAFDAIVAALVSAPPVDVAIIVEHDTNAARVGLDLDPTRLVVFGNPSLGTGLMRTDQSVGLDLPQKILVTRTGDGPTVITWNDPHWVARRHGVTGQRELLDTLSGALANFASVGAGG